MRNNTKHDPSPTTVDFSHGLAYNSLSQHGSSPSDTKCHNPYPMVICITGPPLLLELILRFSLFRFQLLHETLLHVISAVQHLELGVAACATVGMVRHCDAMICKPYALRKPCDVKTISIVKSFAGVHPCGGLHPLGPRRFAQACSSISVRRLSSMALNTWLSTWHWCTSWIP